MITDWFENSDFLEAIIENGMHKMFQDGISTANGIAYVFDKAHVKDAKLIAEAVRRYNEKMRAEG